MRVAFFLLCISALAPGFAFDTDIIYPWVTNSSQFRSIIVIDNLNGASVEVSLTGTRPVAEGDEPETIFLSLAPREQMEWDTGALFTELGEGSGFAVRLTSSADFIVGALIVAGTASPSRSSPAQANVIEASTARTTLVFSYLPMEIGIFSAPVVVNTSQVTASVTFKAYRYGELTRTTSVSVGPGRPFAVLTKNLFPAIDYGSVFVMVESSQPLVGVAFIFNALLEPSMSNAVAMDGGNPIDLLPIE